MDDSSDDEFYESGSESDIDEITPQSRPMSPTGADTIAPTPGTVAASGTATPSGAPAPLIVKDRREKHLTLPRCLPYPTESLEEMDNRLEAIARSLADCVKAGAWDSGFGLWLGRLENWMCLKYPMKKTMRARLALLCYSLATMPGLDPKIMGAAANMVMSLLKRKKLINIHDLRLDWRPLHALLIKELWPKRRKAGHTNLSTFLLDMAEVAQRFFHPSETQEMLEAILPRMQGDDIDSVLATQAFMVHFLPLSHPQDWLPVLFRIWQEVNSGLYDEQMLDVLARLTVMHVNPKVSNPKRVGKIPKSSLPSKEEDVDMMEVTSEVDDDASEGNEVTESDADWPGIRKDIGLLTETQFDLVMTKCLRSLSTPVGGALASAAAGTKTPTDGLASKTILSMRRPTSRLHSLSLLIVYSMCEDAPESSSSTATPGTVTPREPPHKKSHLNGLPAIDSTDSLAAAAKKEDARQACLAGSKALEHLNKLLLSCETFFHPSNHGQWSVILAAFIRDLAWDFLRRWKEEEQTECKTPAAWRLTPKIKRAFVNSLRDVALMSMFSKDSAAQTATRECLRSLSLLEADLIVPAIIERAVPSLQGLEETHRTSAVLKALSGVSYAICVGSGRENLMAILDLILPGVDVNDPTKTVSTIFYIMNQLSLVRIGDISDEPSEEYDESLRNSNNLLAKPQAPSTTADSESTFRSTTAMAGPWLSDLVDRIFQLYDNMPDDSESRGPRSGVSAEEQVVAMCNTLLDGLISGLSEELFDQVLEQIFRRVTSMVRSNSVRVVSGLLTGPSNANPIKTLEKFLVHGMKQALSELESGAASVGTTTTTTNIASDAPLLWHLACIYGSIANAGSELLPYKDQIVSFLQTLTEKALSESAWSWTGRIIDRILLNLTTTYTKEVRFVNAAEWESPDFQRNHHHYWGKQYRLSEIVPQWHSPSTEEVDFAIAILDKVMMPGLDRLESLLDVPRRDQSWHVDVCRWLSHARSSVDALKEFAQEPPHPDEPGEPANDAPFLPPTFLDRVKPYACGFVLTNPSDPRYQWYQGYRKRLGTILHKTTTVLQELGQDTFIDAVRLNVRCISTYLLSYGMPSKEYDAELKSSSYHGSSWRFYSKQKHSPRFALLKRMEMYHFMRMRLESQRRQRSAMTDTLIKDLLNMSLSLFVKVRKAAQSTLSSLFKTFDGVRALCLPIVLEAIRPGIDPDVMKGALYLLKGKSLAGLARYDPRFTNDYVLKLMTSQWQEKPSLQVLLGEMINSTLSNLSEPMTLLFGRLTPLATDALARFEEILPPQTSDIMPAVMEGATRRRDLKNARYDDLLSATLALATSPATHWKYATAAAQLLRFLLRRDRPTPPDVARYFMENVTHTQPALRATAQGAVTRLLYFIKLRSLCPDEEAWFLQEAKNPLKRRRRPEDTGKEATSRYLQAMRNLDVDPAGAEEQWMQDKGAVGWLCWGHEITESRLAGWDEQPFVWKDTPTIEAMEAYVADDAWWAALAKDWSQEKHRKYLSADNIDLLRSCCQIWADLPFQRLKPILETYLNQLDKDKQRALAEFIAGLLRGSKHWNGKARQGFWDWLTPRLPKIYANIRPDTFEYWKMFFEHVMYQRDPRRLGPLVSFILNNGRAVEFVNSTSADLRSNLTLVSAAIRCFTWRFSPWAEEFRELYWKNGMLCDYSQISGLVAQNISLLDVVEFHPSFPNVSDFVQDCISRPRAPVREGANKPLLDAYMKQLPVWREERPSGAEARLSSYDKAGLTILRWLSSAFAGIHAQSAFTYILPLLPELLQMREMVDGGDLHKQAALLLVFLTATNPPVDVVEPLMRSILDIVTTSKVWKTRLHALPIVSIIYYRSLPLISEELASTMMHTLSLCLQDENQEVRETAAGTLAGILRCSRRSSVVVLKDRFVRECKSINLPARKTPDGNMNPAYQGALVKLHAAVLGVTALIDAFPYTVPSFVPNLLTEVLASHASDPSPISTTVRACASSFKRTHQDTWEHEDRAKFTEDQLSALTYMLSGNSYYA